MRDVRWFFRGVQSAIFLYVSCGPCHDATDRRRRRKAAKRSRAEKEKLREADPVAHHQPAPFEINPFWHEEIEAGPGPPARRVKKVKNKPATSPVPSFPQSADGDAQVSASKQQAPGGGKLEAKMEQYRDRLKSLDPAHIKESWHNRRQRRDEEYSSDEDGDALPGLPHMHLRRHSQTPRTRQSGRYYYSRVPPVNDLHPPVVCAPSPHRAERRWMKEAPPSAAFMAGKEGTRASAPSRKGSRASTMSRVRAHSSPRTSSNLSRQATSKAWEERIRGLPVHLTSNQIAIYDAASSSTTFVPSRSSLNEGDVAHAPMTTKTSSSRPGRSKSLGVHASHPGNENISPSESAHSSPSPKVSPQASPIPFQARTPSTSITSAPATPQLGPQRGDHAHTHYKLAESETLTIVRHPSLDALQELVFPSALLNTRHGRPSSLDGNVDTRRDADGDGDGDDGWLWTDTGERRWRDAKEARDVRNRWSIDF